jgi:hypothetical protein
VRLTRAKPDNGTSSTYPPTDYAFSDGESIATPPGFPAAGGFWEMRIGVAHLRFAGAVEVGGGKKGLRTED